MKKNVRANIPRGAIGVTPAAPSSDGRVARPARPHAPWPRVKLGEVCETINGLWKGVKPPFKNVGVIRATNFTKSCEFSLEKTVFLDVEEHKFKNRKLVPGDLIVERSGGGPGQPVGRTVVFPKIEGDYSISNFTSILRIKNSKVLESHYLHRCLTAFYYEGITEKMQSNTTGLHNLDFEAFLKIEFPLPPLPVQREIVARLERELGAVDKLAKKFEELETAAEAEFKAELAEEMGRLGQMGQLGRDAAVAEVSGVADVPLTPTRWAKLGEVCEILDSQRVPITKTDRKSGPYPYYGASGIVDYVADYIFDGNYLLVSEDGANLLARSTPIAFSVSGKLWVNNHAHILAFDEMTTQTYVEYFFEATKFDALITGAAQPKLTQKALAGIELPLPPLPVQREIVARLDAAKAKKEALVSAAKRGRETAALWRKAILKEAFE